MIKSDKRLKSSETVNEMKSRSHSALIKNKVREIVEMRSAKKLISLSCLRPNQVAVELPQVPRKLPTDEFGARIELPSEPHFTAF